MAKEVLQRIIDDLDGSEGAASVEFGLDGRLYSIDLSARNEAEMRAVLAPFLERASKVAADRRGGGVRRGALRATDHERNQAIRAWALENGVELASRGRIANGVVQAFDDNDVDALYAATGLERDEPVEEKPKRRRKSETVFSSAE